MFTWGDIGVYQVRIRPLILGYLVLNEKATYSSLILDIKEIVKRLDQRSIGVECFDDDEVELLIEYWREKGYLEISDKEISLLETRKSIFNRDFIENRLFDSYNTKTIVNTYEEVLKYEIKSNT